MLIAIKTHALNPENTFNVPSYWPWKRLDIRDNLKEVYEAEGWTVYTVGELKEYMESNRPKIDAHFLSQLSTTPTYLDISIVEKKKFADDLIDRLKKKNITEGITGLKGLWMHQRVRALPVTLPGGAPTMTVDLMNMVVSGDLELACLSLMYTPADDMTMPWHWLSQERLNWIIAELKKFLQWP